MSSVGNPRDGSTSNSTESASAPRGDDVGTRSVEVIKPTVMWSTKGRSAVESSGTVPEISVSSVGPPVHNPTVPFVLLTFSCPSESSRTLQNTPLQISSVLLSAGAPGCGLADFHAVHIFAMFPLLSSRKGIECCQPHVVHAKACC